MHDYRLGDVERILGISPGVVRALIRQRFVTPARGRRGEYRFAFQDLIALRAARSLARAGMSGRRIARSLRELRRRLPERVPLAGLSIRALGDQVIVREGRSEWDSSSGQYVLELEVTLSGGDVRLSEPARAEPAPRADPGAAAEELYSAAVQLEDTDPPAAARLYQRCVALHPEHCAARINLGRLLQQAGDLRAAEQLYRHPACLTDAVALFNLAVLLEDAERPAEAIESYTAALAIDPQLADAHYNLARLHELQGNAAHTLRHLRMYRTLAGKSDRS